MKPTQLQLKKNLRGGHGGHVKPTQLQLKKFRPAKHKLEHDVQNTDDLSWGFQIQPLQWHSNSFIKEPKTHRVQSTGPTEKNSIANLITTHGHQMLRDQSQNRTKLDQKSI